MEEAKLNGKIPYNPADKNLDIVRQIVFARLKNEPEWKQLDNSGYGFDRYVEYVGRPNQKILAFQAQDVFWQLVVEGILAPGMNPSNMNLPWFHLTKYGELVINEQVKTPHDPTGYLARIKNNIEMPDSTVMAYLTEGLLSFERGSLVASIVMLGVASERVFLLLCQSMLIALEDEAELKKFKSIVDRFPMKPKLDWMHTKIQSLQERRLSGLPENSTLMLTTIYDLIRNQRNELGHPREAPPQMKREDAYVNFLVFPRYYEIAEEVRAFLLSNRV